VYTNGKEKRYENKDRDWLVSYNCIWDMSIYRFLFICWLEFEFVRGKKMFIKAFCTIFSILFFMFILQSNITADDDAPNREANNEVSFLVYPGNNRS